jgi:S1-C subfamily serine protease
MWYIRIGTRTTGPHTIEELKTLRGRGQFSPLHLISRNGRDWQSAADFVQQMDNASLSQSPAQKPPTRTANPGKEAAVWYYLAPDRSQVGPRTISELAQLAQSRELLNTTLVCKTGDTAWIAASAIPELAGLFTKKRNFQVQRTAMIAGIIAAVLITLPVVGLLVKYSLKLFQSTTANCVAGPLDESALSDAVGLVVGTYRPIVPGEASPARMKSGTGTAFAITPDGYLLTNDHVAVMADEAHIRRLRSEYFLTLAEDAAQRAIAESDSEERQKLLAFVEAFTNRAGLYMNDQQSLDPKLTVLFDGVSFDAKVVHRDSRQGRDMAILKIERVPRPCFALSSSEKPSKGSRAWVAGFPGIANQARTAEAAAIEDLNTQMGTDPIDALQPAQLEHSLTEGIVNRVVEQPSGLWEIEHSVQINQGNSGGPVFREDGTVVGLVNRYMKVDDNRQNLAQSIAQFRKDLESHIPSPIIWRD